MGLSDILNVFWILFLISTIIPVISKRARETRRRMVIDAIERKRGSRLITLIHRQETMSILGIPISRYIDIVLHTPGGLVLAAEQIAFALCRHKAKVTVFVPHYAMSGGTLVAIAADEIVMDPNGVLGPVDPQLQVPQTGGYVPAVSVLAAMAVQNPNRDDQTLIMADLAEKAIQQVHNTVYRLLRANKMEDEKADGLADALSKGRWTHDYPISVSEAQELGLPATDDMPKEIYGLMDLYPQAAQRRPSVEFIPTPYGPSRPTGPGQGE